MKPLYADADSSMVMHHVNNSISWLTDRRVIGRLKWLTSKSITRMSSPSTVFQRCCHFHDYCHIPSIITHGIMTDRQQNVAKITPWLFRYQVKAVKRCEIADMKDQGEKHLPSSISNNICI